MVNDAELAAGLERAEAAWVRGEACAARLLEEIDPAIQRLVAGGVPDRKSLRRWRIVHLASRPARLIAHFCLTLGRAWAADGEYEAALVALWEGRDHSGNAPQLDGHLLGELATVQCEYGELAGAMDSIDTIRKKPGTLSASLETKCLELEAEIGILRGDLGDALVRFEDIVTLHHKAGSPHITALALANLARARCLCNQHEAAGKLLELAESLLAGTDQHLRERLNLQRANAQRARPVHVLGFDVLPTVGQMGGWSHRDDEDEHAPGARHESWSVVSSFLHPRFLSFFEARVAELDAIGASDVDALNECLNDLHVDFGEVRALRLEATLHIIDAAVDLRSGRVTDVIDILQRVLPALQEREFRLHELEALRLFIRARGLMGHDDPPARKRLADLTDAIAATLNPSDRETYLIDKHRQRDWHLARELDQMTATNAERLVGAVTPTALPPNTGVIRYDSLPDRLVIRSAGTAGRFLRVVPVGRVELLAAVRRLHESLAVVINSKHRVGRAEHDRLVAQSLAELATMIEFFEIVEELGKEVRSLRITMDGALHAAPFCAFGWPEAPLVRTHAVCRQIEEASSDAARFHAIAEPRRALVVVPLNVRRDIPKAREEADEVRRHLTANDFAIHSDPHRVWSPEEARCAIEEVQLAHFACHGRFSPESPDSGLVLDKGTLSLDTLARLNLTNLRLTVLSACWGGDAFLHVSGAALGVTHTLLRSGASTVLSHLWGAPDEPARYMMDRFYTHARICPATEAVRRAQGDYLDMMRGETGRQITPTNPLLWSGLIVSTTAYDETPPLGPD